MDITRRGFLKGILATAGGLVGHRLGLSLRLPSHKTDYVDYLLVPPHGYYCYWVKSDIGDNSNDGLAPHRAWRTVDHAAANTPPGSTVFVSGYHPEKISIIQKGCL